MRKTGRSLKETVNEMLRIGLTAPRPEKPPVPFKIYARDLGARPGLNFDNIEELLDQIEGPLRR